MNGLPEQLTLDFDSLYLPTLTPDEIYTKADQELLSLLKEDRRLERKPVGIHGRELGKYFSMWANTSPSGGLIVVGMEDKGAFSGCDSASQERINDIEKAAKIYCPEAKYQSKRIILFRVHYNEMGRLIKTIEGKAYTRVADELTKLDDDTIKQLESDRGQIDFEQERCDLSYPVDFNLELIHKYAKNYQAVRIVGK